MNSGSVITNDNMKLKMGRMFRTLHDQWMNIINWNDFNSLSELNDSLYNYVENTYNRKKHSSIDARPIDKFLKHIDNLKMISSKKELDYMFLYRVNRTGYNYLKNKRKPRDVYELYNEFWDSYNTFDEKELFNELKKDERFEIVGDSTYLHCAGIKIKK